LWEAEGEVGKRDGQIRCGCRYLTTIREIEMPVLSEGQRLHIAEESLRQSDRMLLRKTLQQMVWLEWGHQAIRLLKKFRQDETLAGRYTARAAQAAYLMLENTSYSLDLVRMMEEPVEA
jgi:hypothetical protein